MKNTISEIVADYMKKPKKMIINKGEDPSTYTVSTKVEGSQFMFKIGLISKIGREWLCLYSYGSRHGTRHYETWHTTLRDSKVHFQCIIVELNGEGGGQ